MSPVVQVPDGPRFVVTAPADWTMPEPRVTLTIYTPDQPAPTRLSIPFLLAGTLGMALVGAGLPPEAPYDPDNPDPDPLF